MTWVGVGPEGRLMSVRDELIARVMAREGGVADVGDGQGVTRWGQTPRWLSHFNLDIPTNAAEAADNYATWMAATRLDRLLADQVDALADAVVDLAVHSGHVTAIKALQRAVHVDDDGVIGPVTIDAVAIDSDRQAAAATVIAWRMEQQGHLIARRPDKYARYALGWARRNAEHVRNL